MNARGYASAHVHVHVLVEVLFERVVSATELHFWAGGSRALLHGNPPLEMISHAGGKLTGGGATTHVLDTLRGESPSSLRE